MGFIIQKIMLIKFFYKVIEVIKNVGYIYESRLLIREKLGKSN